MGAFQLKCSRQIIPEDYVCFSVCCAAIKNYFLRKSDCIDHPAVIGGHGKGQWQMKHHRQHVPCKIKRYTSYVRYYSKQANIVFLIEIIEKSLKAFSQGSAPCFETTTVSQAACFTIYTISIKILPLRAEEIVQARILHLTTSVPAPALQLVS